MDARHLRSRRQVLSTAVGAAACWAAGIALADPPQPINLHDLLPPLREIRAKLLTLAREMVDPSRLTRADGYVYAVDVGQLLCVFAQCNEAAAYVALRDFAEEHFILDGRAEAFARGFVAWRWKPSAKADASGTTEALRLARALWIGGSAFNRPTDVELAMNVLAGYAKHAGVDQGVWMVRNYYNLAARCFANNSYLVDYDPDLLRQIAESRNAPDLGKLAERSYTVVKLAVAPSGLLYDIIQPEVTTLYPELGLTAFSPNDIVQFSNCCVTALTVVNGLPEISRKVLALGMNRLADLRTYYVGRTAEPFNARKATVSEYSVLARLAARLGAADAAATIADRAMNDWKWCVAHPAENQVYTITEMLQTMTALIDLGR